jgi:hypothetical protein
VTGPVRPVSAGDQAWSDLGAELTPARSLDRIDNATSRTVTTVTVIGVLLTGLGALSATLPADDGPVRGLATAAVITAALAVASALTAQILTITRRVNPANLLDVQAWFRRQFIIRAYPARAATVLLLAAALLAGAAATVALTTTPAAAPASAPAIGVTQVTGPGTSTIITVRAAFSGLAPGQAVTVTIATPARVLARSAATPGPAGTATTTLTVSQAAPPQPVTITARTTGQTCQARLSTTGGPPALTCRAAR